MIKDKQRAFLAARIGGLEPVAEGALGSGGLESQVVHKAPAALDDAVVDFDDFTLGPLSISINSGEICCLVGPNGAGKTTLIRALLGLVRLNAGGATISGYPSRGRPPEVLRMAGFVPDDFTEVIPELTARELWELHAFAHARNGGNVDALLRRAQEIAESLDFAPPSIPISAYSHGMCKKTQIVAALMHDPHLVVVDEPMNGLDPIAIRRLDEIFFSLRARGRGILLATHDLYYAERSADHVVFLNQGALLAQGDPASLLMAGEKSLAEAFFRLLGASGP